MNSHDIQKQKPITNVFTKAISCFTGCHCHSRAYVSVVQKFVHTVYTRCLHLTSTLEKPGLAPETFCYETASWQCLIIRDGQYEPVLLPSKRKQLTDQHNNFAPIKVVEHGCSVKQAAID